jgi:aminoglycoside 3'-phosphotransferase-2
MVFADRFATGLPPDFRDMLTGYSWARQTIGHSDAHVFKMEADNRPVLFLKTEPDGPFSELADEAARLRWLAGQDIPCPQVTAFEIHDGYGWLLTSAVAGKDLVSSGHVPASSVIAIVAGALRELHTLDVRTCPFDHSLDRRIAHARVRMEAGIVDEADFDDEREDRTAREIFEELLALRPSTEEPVVAHGDACLPNFMADGGRFSGFVDCSRLAVADRYQDLALTCWSIRLNLGEEWVQPFLALYGLPEADPEKLSYYRLLDEFF